MNFTFDGSMSGEVLKSYLSRAATAAGLYQSDTLEDDLRAVKELGIKFLGRASGVWYMTEDDEEHFEKSKKLAERVHEIDTEIILQACIFEIITEKIEEIPVPDHVFEAFGLPAQRRCFRLRDALFLEEPAGYIHKSGDPAKNGGIPDLNRVEARMWFYYRAARYIDCGYEALHMGQAHLYAANDRGMAKTAELFDKIRRYAGEHARRHKVLMDAHTHGVSIRGKLLFDYHAMPYTRVPLLEREGQKLVLVREGFSEGGENPDGYTAPAMPYLMEYDNWGGLAVEDPSAYTREELAFKDWWGYDQIGWFANQDQESRNHFLEYTYKWTQICAGDAYFAVPFRRMLSDAAVRRVRADNGENALQPFYQCNKKSAGCPMGFGQEETVRRLWERGDELREKAGNPAAANDYGAKDVYDPETGVKLPERVVVYGSFQPSAGAVRNDSNSEVTRMYYVGEQTYRLAVIIPYAGEYDFAVSTYGTLSATYCGDGYPRSGSSNKGNFRTAKDNSAVVFSYRFPSQEVKVEVIE